MRLTKIWIFLIVAVLFSGSAIGEEYLSQQYEGLLLLNTEDYRSVDGADEVFRGYLLPRFSRAVRNAKSFSYDYRGTPAYFDKKGPASTEQEQALKKANRKLLDFLTRTLPVLAYVYQTPGPSPGANPYYQDEKTFALYLEGLDYCYSRGMTEDAWVLRIGGRSSDKALKKGHKRTSGDFSTVSLQLGGFVQSIFLMRKPLREKGLLEKYRRVAHNLSVNNGAMSQVFFQFARAEITHSNMSDLSPEKRYLLTADGFRLFVDYFLPYYFLIEDRGERDRMTDIIKKVIDTNIVVMPGTQGVIKPDGTAYHHGTAYVGSYTPYALEAMAQLLYLTSGTGLYHDEHVNAVKSALQAYRIMTQLYVVPSPFKGRLIAGGQLSPSVAVAKAMAFLAHPGGPNDDDMKAQFAEFFDSEFFYTDDNFMSLCRGRRGVLIRGFGILRLIAALHDLSTKASEPPQGVWIKPYAAGAFFRRDGWLVAAKGFSQYVWDYEGPLDKQQNVFGQNWSNGSLMVYKAIQTTSEKTSGYDYFNGWDWYHVPGTTATHYPIAAPIGESVKNIRKRLGIAQRSTHRNYNTRTFVGGVSIGQHGLFVQDLEALPFTSPTDLSARKTYFLVGDKVLALGTHIRGGTDNNETHTTIFQVRLPTDDAPSTLDERELRGLKTDVRLPAGSTAAMTDSVGNSYFLAHSSADLVLTRQLQHSMTPNYKPTNGTFVQAYLNHGIKPQGDSYQYVLIPNDPSGRKLRAVAEQPTDYFNVIEADQIHLAVFREHRIVGYAFYELVETPQAFLVKSVNLFATVMTQEDDSGITLAASVPDIGWRFDDRIISQGLSYAKDNFRFQKAKTHALELTLRGRWRLAEDADVVHLSRQGDETTLTLECVDGLSRRVRLVPTN